MYTYIYIYIYIYHPCLLIDPGVADPGFRCKGFLPARPPTHFDRKDDQLIHTRSIPDAHPMYTPMHNPDATITRT